MWFKKKQPDDEQDHGNAQRVVHDLISSFEQQKKHILDTSIEQQLPPVEVRALLEELQEEYDFRIEEVEAEYHDEIWENDELEEEWDTFKRRTLKEFVDTETKKYIRTVKKSATTADVFANASTKQNVYSKNLSTKAQATLVSCESCGAARIDINQYDHCTYCGQPLFQRNQ